MAWQRWWLLLMLRAAAMPHSAGQSGEVFLEPLETYAVGAGGGAATVDRESATMLPFPGSETSALQLMALPYQETAPRIEMTSRLRLSRSGWYRVRFFLNVAVSYNGHEGPVTLQVVDSQGEPLWPEHRVLLRAPRAEWLFYEEYVSGNMVLGVLDGHAGAMLSALQIIIDPGDGFTSGSIQLTGLSVEFVEVADRPGLVAIDLCDCTEERTSSGRCGSGALPSCRNPAGCPVAELGDSEAYPSSGTCQDAFISLDGTSAEAAYDGVALPDDVGWYIAGSAAAVVTLQMEIPGGPVPVCAAVLTFGRWSYPQRWRLGANSNPNESYRTWVSAGRVSGVTGREWREATARGATWVSSGGGAIELALECDDAWNVRLEMEDARGAARVMNLIEMELQTVFSPGWLTCDCRHGGICTGGACDCPLATGCSLPECGWTGSACDESSCVAEILCHNLGGCGGPNTCSCAPGWHGTSGLDQCLMHHCGDGELSESSGEMCDDGNTADGDGCDAKCQLEQLPAGHARVLSEWTRRWKPRDEIYAENLTLDVLAGTLGVRQQQLRGMEESKIDGVAGVFYEEAEFVIQCERECWHGGTCFTLGWLTDFQPDCTCPEPPFDGPRCANTKCERACDHGGYCSSDLACVQCAEGWTGTYCGTLSSSFGVVIVWAAGIISASLFFAATAVFARRNDLYRCGREGPDGQANKDTNSSTMIFAPLQARGLPACVGNCCGGSIWLLMTVVSLRGELFQYDSSSITIRVPMMVLGFGTWHSSILMYLQSMATVHIKHRIPLTFCVKFPLSLVPWILVCQFDSIVVAIIVSGCSSCYSILLLATLWPLRADLVDILYSFIFSILGHMLIVATFVTMLRAEHVRSDPWATDEEVASAFSAPLHLSIAAATVIVVFGHFVTSHGRMMHQLIFCSTYDPDYLRNLYYCENVGSVARDDEGTREDELAEAAMAASSAAPTQNASAIEREVRSREMLAAFDKQVVKQAEQLLDATLRARLERHFSLEKRQAYEARFAALCAEAEPGYVPEPEDWLQATEKIAEEARAVPREPGWDARFAAALVSWYGNFTQRTRLGHWLDRHSFARDQFAMRQKLTPETLRRLGRVAPPSPPEDLPSTVISDLVSASVGDQPGLLDPVEFLPGQAAGAFAGDLSHPSRKSKMRPEHRHLSMHHRTPPPRPVHVVVKRSDHYTLEVNEREHELAKLNGCYGKAQLSKEQKECNTSTQNQVHALRAKALMVEKRVRHQQLPPLENPPRQPSTIAGDEP